MSSTLPGSGDLLALCATKDMIGGLCDRCKELGETQLEPVNLEVIEPIDPVATDVPESSSHDPAISRLRDPIVGRAPLEISCYIFELYVDLHQEEISYEFIYNGIHPSVFLRLGAVCQSWRRIAWSCPRLWTTLAVDIISNGCRYAPVLAMEWIQRAGALPLSIVLHDSSWDRPEDTLVCADCAHRNALSLINVINLFSSRWERLALSIPLNLIQHIDDSGPEDDGRTSILRELHFSAEHGTIYNSLTSMIGPSSTTLFKSSSLKHSPSEVTLSDDAELDSLEIRWTNVLDIHADQIAYQDACKVFRRAPLLQTCTFNLFGSRYDIPQVTEPIIVKSLCALTVQNKDDCEAPLIGPLLGSLTLPSLEEFSYFESIDNPPVPVQSIISLVQRSQCRLQCLELTEPTMADSELIRVLQEIPSLEVLELSLTKKNDAQCLLEHLGTIGPEGTLHLPNLEYLNLKAYRTFSWTSLANIFGPIQAFKTPYPSQRLNLEVDMEVRMTPRGIRRNPISQGSLIRFIQLRRSGVAISIYKFEEEIYHNLIKEAAIFHFPPELPQFAMYHKGLS